MRKKSQSPSSPIKSHRAPKAIAEKKNDKDSVNSCKVVDETMSKPLLRLVIDPTLSDSDFLKQLEHFKLVRQTAGKYAHLPTSSDAFAKQKHEEIERE